jgi:hypothetical protein
VSCVGWAVCLVWCAKASCSWGSSFHTRVSVQSGRQCMERSISHRSWWQTYCCIALVYMLPPSTASSNTLLHPIFPSWPCSRSPLLTIWQPSPTPLPCSAVLSLDRLGTDLRGTRDGSSFKLRLPFVR